MKKFGFILVFIIAFTSCFFSACTEAESEKDEVLVYSFEQYEDMQDLQLSYTLGAMDITEEAQYITEGKGALRVDIQRGCIPWPGPSKELPVLPRVVVDVSNKELSAATVSKISVDVTNLQDYTVNMIVEMRGTGSRAIWSDVFRLQPGMNNAVFNIKNRFYNIEVNENWIDQIRFYFEGNVNHTGYVFDNFRIFKTKQPAYPPERAAEEGVILDFDSSSDMDYINGYVNSTGITSAYLRYGQEYLNLYFLGTDGYGENPLSWYTFATQGYGFDIDAALLEKIENADVKEYLIDVYLDAPEEKGLALKIANADYELTERKIIQPNLWQTLVVKSNELLNQSKLTSFKVELETWDNYEPGCLQIRNIRYK